MWEIVLKVSQVCLSSPFYLGRTVEVDPLSYSKVLELLSEVHTVNVLDPGYLDDCKPGRSHLTENYLPLDLPFLLVHTGDRKGETTVHQDEVRGVK